MNSLRIPLDSYQATLSMDAWYSMAGNYPDDCRKDPGNAARIDWLFRDCLVEMRLKYGVNFRATFEDATYDRELGKYVGDWAVTLHFDDPDMLRLFPILGYFMPGMGRYFKPKERPWL